MRIDGGTDACVLGDLVSLVEPFGDDSIVRAQFSLTALEERTSRPAAGDGWYDGEGQLPDDDPDRVAAPESKPLVLPNG